MRTLLMTLTVALCAIAPATVARADVYVAGTGEPAFTNSAGNTQWVNWSGSATYDSYKLEYDMTDNSVFASTQTTGPMTPDGAGTAWVSWDGVRTLVEGHTYGVCAYGRYTIGDSSAREAGSCVTANGKRTSTTIDRTKPAIAVGIDAGAAYSRTGELDYRIDYTDNLAFPFPANFVCRDIGSAPASACPSGFAYDAACSVPAAMNKVTHFTCTEQLAASAPDGPVTLCVISADAAVPDNPSDADQSGAANNANLSNRVCDSITLDRTAPALSVSASATTVEVGEPVSFTLLASDATSGLSGAYAWDFADGSAAGSGDAPAHTFAAPGTYAVKVSTTDAAGNPAEATRTITVEAPPADTETPDDTGDTPGTGTPGTQTPSTPGTETPAPTATLEISAAKRVKLTRKLKRLAVALRADTAGTASLALVRKGRVHAQGAAAILQPGTVSARLALPRKLKPGTYSVDVTFAPANGAAAISRTLTVKLVAKKKKKARASAASAAPLVVAAGAPRAVPTGELPAPRSTVR